MEFILLYPLSSLRPIRPYAFKLAMPKHLAWINRVITRKVWAGVIYTVICKIMKPIFTQTTRHSLPLQVTQLRIRQDLLPAVPLLLVRRSLAKVKEDCVTFSRRKGRRKPAWVMPTFEWVGQQICICICRTIKSQQ